MDKECRKGGSLFIVARKKINYRFHNPNTVETTADYILKVFMEVNEKGGAGDAGGGREYFGRKLLWRKTRDFGLEVHLCCWKKQGKIRYRY